MITHQMHERMRYKTTRKLKTRSYSYRTHPQQLCTRHARIMSSTQTSYSTCFTCSQITTRHPMVRQVEYGSCLGSVGCVFGCIRAMPMVNGVVHVKNDGPCPWVQGNHASGVQCGPCPWVHRREINLLRKTTMCSHRYSGLRATPMDKLSR